MHRTAASTTQGCGSAPAHGLCARLVQAVTAPFLAVLAMRAVPLTDNEHVMGAPASTAALRAVGISCGYMLYDTCYMLRCGRQG
jgi:hypothetical protein